MMAVDEPIKYGEVLHSLKEKIRLARLRASLNVNRELLNVFWEIGAIVLHQQEQEG